MRNHSSNRPDFHFIDKREIERKTWFLSLSLSHSPSKRVNDVPAAIFPGCNFQTHDSFFLQLLLMIVSASVGLKTSWLYLKI